MPLERIIVVGNDDIASIAATMLAKAVKSPFVEVQLVRPTGPVSAWSTLARAATLLPETAEISDSFGWDELALLRRTRGNFLTGTVMRGFGSAAPGFMPFGAIGEPAGQVACHHVIARCAEIAAALPLSAFMGGAICAQMERFAPPSTTDAAGQAAFNYGLHIDNERYTAMLIDEAVANGVTMTSAAIALVTRSETGNITCLTTDDGTAISGDLYVDCGSWLDENPATIDWADWLPCNRMATMRRETSEAPSISMQVVAHNGGWQRQSSVFGAVVDSFAFCDVVPGEWPDASVPFRSGRCKIPWNGNCVAVGDGAVIIDPICDMRLHLAMSATQRLAQLLPAAPDQHVEAREYNRQTVAELDHARDFAIAHYCLNGRTGDPFWDHCRSMTLPETLQARIALYRSCGRIAAMDHETQPATSWVSLFDAVGIRPDRHDALADLLSLDDIERHLGQVRTTLMTRVKSMPSYGETAKRIHYDHRQRLIET